MKKKTLLIILLCIFIPVALAATGAGDFGDGQGGNSGTNLKPADGDTIFGTNSYSKYGVGIRFSFVNSDGEHLGSKDYMPSGDYDPFSTNSNANVKVSDQGYSKVTYIKNNEDPQWNISKPLSDSGIKSLDYLENLINDEITVDNYTYKYEIDFSDATEWTKWENNNVISYTDIIEKLSENLTGKKTSGFTITAEINNSIRKVLFERLYREITGGDIEEHKIQDEQENIYDIFLILEPILWVKIDSVNYIGTDYELAKESSKYVATHNNCKGSTGLCDLGSPLRRVLPCASYLSGILDEQTSGIDFFNDKFTSNSYFDGAIKIMDSNNIDKICSQDNNKFDHDQILGNYGIALGVVWVSSGFVPDDDDGGGGGDPEPDNYNCSPTLSYGTCNNGNDVSYSDMPDLADEKEYWDNCIFNDNGYYESYFSDVHKWSDEDKDLTYYEENLGSDYCPVYCIEEVTAQFTTPNIEVEAGSKFTLGTSTVTGSRTCKTEYIDWDRFKEDLKEANAAIEEEYENYIEALDLQESIDDADPSTYRYPGTIDNPCCNSEDVEVTESSEEDSSCENIDCTPKPYTVCSYSAGGYIWSYSFDGHEQDCPMGEYSENKPFVNVTEAERNYENAVDNANAIINAMKSCYDWDADDIYMVDPNAILEYEDNNVYELSTKLIGTTTYFDVISNFVFNPNQITIEKKECSENGCIFVEVDIPQYSEVEMTRSAETTFSLPVDTYRYVLKSNHESVHSKDEVSGNYIDIGYGNLPVSFSAPAGIYGDGHDLGKLNIEYSNLGHITNDSEDTAVDKIMDNDDIPGSDSYGQWICQYEVITNLFPDPDGDKLGDINLIYRPIDLSNPFPGINGTGRETGSNWCNDGDCSNDNGFVEYFILKNRGEDTDDVYNIEPMYSFTLTPSIIREIRNYNKENTYTSYTGKLGDASYNYECYDNEGIYSGKACVSGYLTYLIETYDKNSSGVCIDDKYRDPNEPGSFYSCQTK